MNKAVKIIFLLVLLWLTGNVSAQPMKELGSPLIQNYTDKEYGTDSPQNWSIVQDKRGVMYFGNTEGVLEYDGKTWRLIKISNNSIPWSMAMDSKGIIYVGAVGEFGYLASNTKGQLSFVSLLGKVAETDRNCGDIKDVCILNDDVYFVGRSNIYIFRNGKIELIKTDLQPLKGFVVYNDIFIVNRQTGIYCIQDSKLKHLPFSDEFKSDFKEFVLFPFSKGQILIGNREKGLNLYDMEVKNPQKASDCIKNFPTEVNDYLKVNQITTGLKLSNDQFAFGTLSGGIVIMERNGRLQQIINKNRGLNSNGMYSLFIDQSQNLWAGLINGIAKIEINSPISKFNDLNGFEGLVLSMGFFKGKQYIGTTNGVYLMPYYKMNLKNDKYKFQHIKNTESSVWEFYNFRNKLLTQAPLGLGELKDSSLVKINEIGQILTYARSSKFPDHLFLGLRTGLLAIKATPNGGNTVFSESKKFGEINTAVWELIADSSGDLWISNKFDGIQLIHFPEKNNFNKFTITKFDTSDGLPAMDYNTMILLKGKMVIGAKDGVYSVVPNNKGKPYKFVPENTFGKILNSQKIDVKQLIIDKEEKIWVRSDKLHIAYLTKNPDNNYAITDKPFSLVGYVDNFYIDSTGIGWFCTNHALLKYNPQIEKEYNTLFYAIIRKVTVGGDSLIFGGTFYNESVKRDNTFPVAALKQKPKGYPVLKYNENSIAFEFSGLYFENEAENQFCYYLEGFNREWCNWTREIKKEYTNLHEGTYIFKVKARNIYGVESSVAMYKFKIQAPWYRTYIAYLCYIILISAFFYILIKINTRRLVAKNEKLEKLVKERTTEVELQKEELQAQADSLELTNRELEKLSIVARETDNAIVILDAQGNFEWINESLTRIYGYETFEQYVEDKGNNILQCSSSPMIREIFEECLRTKKSVVYENLTYSKSGTKFWAQTTITPIIGDNGEVKKLVAIDTDITKIKEAEEEIKQQHEEITAQRELLSITNIELTKNNKLITDSIKYSKRIQEAILPSMKYFTNQFPDSFIFYRPRDIVSGDFYWMSQLDNKIYFAVADCTGHGVPGALMSMIGNTILNEIVNEKKIATPSKILDLLNLRVVAALEKGREPDDIQSDGMDISVVCIDPKTGILQIASANSNCILFKNGIIHKLTSDIYAIGDIFTHNDSVVYKNHEFTLEDGDTIYLYSDGFQDQFGGSENKKFMALKFEQLLAEAQDKSMNEQLSLISSTFELWKNTNKQTDDVLIMGIRFHI